MKKLKFQNLSGERLDLVKVTMDGLDDIHEYSIMEDFFTYFEYNTFKSKNQSRIFIENLMSLDSQNSKSWFIRLKDGKVIGTFVIRDINIKRKSCEIAYGLSPCFWGQGYFQEAMKLVITYLFKKLKFHRILAKVHINNKKSIRSLKNIGFKYEGKMRDFLCDEKENRFDVVFLSLLKYDGFRKDTK